jgi:hypothetical protein
MRTELLLVPPREDDRPPVLPSCGARSVLFLCDETADADAFEAVARALPDCDVSFAPGARPAGAAWLARFGLGRFEPPRLRIVEHCAARGLALDLRHVPLDHELVVRPVRGAREARRVDHLCVPTHALRRRLQDAGVAPHRLSVTGSPAADDAGLRTRAAEGIAAVCRTLLDRPAMLRELRFWREVGVLRADW